MLCRTVVGKYDRIKTKVLKPSFVEQIRICEKEGLMSSLLRKLWNSKRAMCWL